MTSSNASWSRVIPNKQNQLVTDERYTPEWILKMVEAILGGIDLDPAADLERELMLLIISLKRMMVYLKHGQEKYS